MKRIVKILSLILCVCVSFTVLVSCGKNSEEQKEYNDPNENYSNQMTLNEVLVAVYDNVAAACNTDYADTTCFSEVEISDYNFYDGFVQAIFSVLLSLSENEVLQVGKYICSDESAYTIRTGYANKLEMLYITRDNEDYQNSIKIYMTFSKSGYGAEALSTNFLIFCYEIEFNEKTNETTLVCYAENSELAAYSSTNTTAEYYYLSYSSDLKTLAATKFRRLRDFDYSNTSLYLPFVDRFSSVTFNTAANAVIYPQLYSDPTLSNTNNIDMVKYYFSAFEQVELVIFSLETDLEIEEEDKVLISGLTDELILTVTSLTTSSDSVTDVIA